jgi:hypothetical protein
VTSVRRVFDRLLHEERDAYLLGLVRLLLGVLLAVHVWQRFEELEGWAYFGDVFHIPLVPEAWVPSRSSYEALLGLQFLGAGLAVLGFYGREGLAVASSIGLYLLTCDRLQYHNNRFALLLACFLIAFTASDRSFRIYRGARHALPREQRIAPTLPRRLLQLQVSLIYLSSGGGKLLDPDWRGGQSMLVRFEAGVRHAIENGVHVPEWYATVLTSPLTASVASKAAISLELFLALGLWLTRTRAIALWAGAIFHLAIQASARVELFSWLMGACYIAFVTPEIRERRVVVDRETAIGRIVERLLQWFDWLARFEVVEPSGAARGPTSVVDRDGRETSGWGVSAALARGLPAFYLAWPVLYVSCALRRRLTHP